MPPAPSALSRRVTAPGPPAISRSLSAEVLSLRTMASSSSSRMVRSTGPGHRATFSAEPGTTSAAVMRSFWSSRSRPSSTSFRTTTASGSLKTL